ncbi:MAG: pantoate--beta-alanine ligase [Rickettsiales bacterium]|nr:pantoate--beta-alanine ligase [Rickettsiales bacterium]
MNILKTKSEVRQFVFNLKASGKSIAFVPTMGALHKGHLSLVEIAKQKADIAICSIFVNPTQFGQGEDFEKYPRAENSDIELLKNANCDAVFIPSKDEIYSANNFKILPLEKTDILCGAFRKGHFEGVCLVVAKLFNIVQPDFAIFGEKDFQQVFIINQMVKSLDFNLDVISAKTMREEDGLALSSRNVYLSQEERLSAGKVNKILIKALEDFKSKNNAEKILSSAKNEIINLGFNKIDYLEFRNSDNLEIAEIYSDKTRIFFAGYIGKTRLIDNLQL